MKFLIFFFCLAVFEVSYSQDIKVYFNQSVNNAVSVYADAQTSGNLDDTICKYIDLAVEKLDIAVWDNGSDVITDCINEAYLRGVQVRYITSSNALNSSLSNLNSNIPVLERNSGISSDVMHNKFVIVDESYLITGSMNFNDGAIQDDYNNIVLIHNTQMCYNYRIEFEEMWGGSGAGYSTSASKFGPDKSDNTYHAFVIGGVDVESYFSPTDQTTLHIIEEIDAADYTLDIAMFTFINNDIGDAVIAAHNRGVEVRCIIENENYIGSEFNALQSAGIPVLSHDGIAFDFHHKYCIIDALHTTSDPTVITGSHNWTNSAEEEYDENTLIIHNPAISWQYLEEFSMRWSELGGTLSENTTIHDQEIPVITSVNGITTISNIKQQSTFQICTPDGKIYKTITASAGSDISIALETGVYLLIQTEKESVQKFVVIK
ncbi:MAG: hypothetical protein IPM77_11625 [Crocinitomicaceae bacterium]|nr:hypothetical protein [Crocinitomicaceae bacterium]